MTNYLNEFIETIARLRAPDGCPWDKEQTHDSLARYLLEEVYEVLEAIHLGDPEKLKEELGDLLLQIVLNAQIAKEAGHFDMQDVARSINEKMISRHPHVFSNVTLSTTNQVVSQWEELKDREKEAKNKTNSSAIASSAIASSAIDGIPRTLPALLQALKISEKAVSQGFEWNNQEEVWSQLDSELIELKEEIAKKTQNPEESSRRKIDLELGDVLFVIVNIARWLHLNPEESLLLATEKFKGRFRCMEAISMRPLKELSKEELENLWVQAKQQLST